MEPRPYGLRVQPLAPRQLITTPPLFERFAPTATVAEISAKVPHCAVRKNGPLLPDEKGINSGKSLLPDEEARVERAPDAASSLPKPKKPAGPSQMPGFDAFKKQKQAADAAEAARLEQLRQRMPGGQIPLNWLQPDKKPDQSDQDPLEVVQLTRGKYGTIRRV